MIDDVFDVAASSAKPARNGEPISAVDLAALRQARQALETPGMAMKLASLLGMPFEKLLLRAPRMAHATIVSATEAALQRCLDLALRSLAKPGADGMPLLSRDRWHKLAVATTGAAGGAFGLIALPVELPITTTLMFRSICAVARSEGEDLTAVDTQLQCLMVLGMGGTSKQDDESHLGYFVVRGALAQAVSKAANEIAAKGLGVHGSATMVRLLNAIATRFSVQVSEQIAAKSIPALGAVLGAAVNAMFIGHFQAMAHGHFTVRRLERKYGEATIRDAYESMAPALSDRSPDRSPNRLES
jgi:hypothetical protein